MTWDEAKDVMRRGGMVRRPSVVWCTSGGSWWDSARLSMGRSGDVWVSFHSELPPRRGDPPVKCFTHDPREVDKQATDWMEWIRPPEIP